MLTVITDLGDAALLVPASLALTLYLWSRGNRHSACTFAVAILACATLTALSKIAFRGCGVDAALLDLRSPSGHVALSTTFYFCAALLLTAEAARPLRLIALVATTIVVALIATSRVILQAHTFVEVATGLLIGAVCLAGFILGAPRLPVLKPGWRLSIAAFAALAVVTHGQHLNAEELLQHIALHLRHATGVCE